MESAFSNMTFEAGIFYVLGVGALIFAVAKAVELAMFLSGSRTAVGSVVAVERRGDRARNPFSPRIEFLAADGRRVSILSMLLVQSWRFKIGQPVRVRYKADEPSVAEIDSFFALSWIMLFSAAIGAFFFWVGGMGHGQFREPTYSELIMIPVSVLFWAVSIWMLRNASVRYAGSAVTEGTVVAKVRETPRSEEWRVTFTAENGQVVEFVSAWQKHSLPQPGQKVKVCYSRAVPMDAAPGTMAGIWGYAVFITVMAVFTTLFAAAQLYYAYSYLIY